MADRAISELTAATRVNNVDNFVLEQEGEAKRLTGQTLVNCLAEALDGHGGINKIEKTGTSVLVDTYTITFADETTKTFTVTNGKGIVSIEKTGTSVLVDTYTITYNDNTTETFTVTNGKGISSITKTGTSVLVDTYKIAFNDGTETTFTVTNGKGISSITKTSTSGLVDTYTIAYNDGTSTTFTVTNGEKGDKGDNTYTWIKYSAAEPTQDSDMKDVPDNYIGVYYGSSDTAPAHYTSYQWFKIKGQKGDRGDDITITTYSVQYAEATSGTTAPSNWQDSIPSITPGRFLWTKTAITFSTGETITSYTIARYGVDGTGSVNTVNGIGPDENHNIALPLDADEYDPDNGTYALDAYCTNDNLLYRCITPITIPEAWDSTKWQLTTLSAELRRIMTATWGDIESWG